MKEHLRNVPLFAGLSEEDLDRLCEGAEFVDLAADQALFDEGDAGDRAYVIIEGEVKIIKVTGDREVLLARRHPGDVIGEMALLDSAPRMATVRSCAVTTRVVSIAKERMDELLATSPTAARSLFSVLLERWRQTEAQLRQSERMAQLGTLTAGLAHELNNPAAAVKRSADQLGDATREYGAAREAVARRDLDDAQLATADAFIERARATGAQLDALARSDLEAEMEDVLEAEEVAEAWKLAGELVDAGITPDEVAQLKSDLGTMCAAVLEAAGAAQRTFGLLHEVEEGAKRLSGIVGALKGYSYLDQAALQEIDLTEGIEDTLLILKSQLNGIRVVREYGEDVPKIMAYASELNQVWTNLLANAVDAIHETETPGEITIRTRQSGEEVYVDVVDNGAGIPDEVRDRIFDAFFTTKPPGSGTGLGLDISYNIVVSKHRGDITVESEPGRTIFTVMLLKELRE